MGIGFKEPDSANPYQRGGHRLRRGKVWKLPSAITTITFRSPKIEVGGRHGLCCFAGNVFSSSRMIYREARVILPQFAGTEEYFTQPLV